MNVCWWKASLYQIILFSHSHGSQNHVKILNRHECASAAITLIFILIGTKRWLHDEKENKWIHVDEKHAFTISSLLTIQNGSQISVPYGQKHKHECYSVCQDSLSPSTKLDSHFSRHNIIKRLLNCHEYAYAAVTLTFILIGTEWRLQNEIKWTNAIMNVTQFARTRHYHFTWTWLFLIPP
jgi:hypothetical protein